jgi:hypothetical protein
VKDRPAALEETVSRLEAGVFRLLGELKRLRLALAESEEKRERALARVEELSREGAEEGEAGGGAAVSECDDGGGEA